MFEQVPNGTVAVDCAEPKIFEGSASAFDREVCGHDDELSLCEIRCEVKMREEVCTDDGRCDICNCERPVEVSSQVEIELDHLLSVGTDDRAICCIKLFSR